MPMAGGKRHKRNPYAIPDFMVLFLPVQANRDALHSILQRTHPVGYHVEDEMFVILEGQGTCRFGAENYPVAAGEVPGAPRGGVEYPHKLTNTGTCPQ